MGPLLSVQLRVSDQTSQWWSRLLWRSYQRVRIIQVGFWAPEDAADSALYLLAHQFKMAIFPFCHNH